MKKMPNKKINRKVLKGWICCEINEFVRETKEDKDMIMIHLNCFLCVKHCGADYAERKECGCRKIKITIEEIK
jgi:hypothetical protein